MARRRPTPTNPDIAMGVTVRAAEMRFEEVPDTNVTFFGGSRRESVSRTERDNLAEEVEADVTYRGSYVRLDIATKLVEAGRQARGDRPPEDSLSLASQEGTRRCEEPA